jgi:hypothetical protein
VVIARCRTVYRKHRKNKLPTVSDPRRMPRLQKRRIQFLIKSFCQLAQLSAIPRLKRQKHAAENMRRGIVALVASRHNHRSQIGAHRPSHRSLGPRVAARPLKSKSRPVFWPQPGFKGASNNSSLAFSTFAVVSPPSSEDRLSWGFSKAESSDSASKRITQTHKRESSFISLKEHLPYSFYVSLISRNEYPENPFLKKTSRNRLDT